VDFLSFRYRPSEQRKSTAPSENWYNSLVFDNARRKGVLDPYADHDGVEFVHETLLSVEAFLSGLISVFGDRFMKENAKRALNACKQRSMTIGEYNSQFSSLVYLVEDVEETRIEKYVSGLNPLIIRQAMSTQWRKIKSLDEKMAAASEAAAQLDLLAQLPDSSSSAYRPLSTNRPTGFASPTPQAAPKDPDAMEVDAINSFPRSLLDSSRAICRSKNLCFRCLKSIVPGTHTGSLNCPNSPISMEQRKNFVDRSRLHPPAQVSAISPSPVASAPPPQSQPLAFRNFAASDEPSPSSPPEIHGFDELYDDYDETDCSTVSVSSVHVRLDCSAGGRIVVPATFKAPNGVLISATILVDTGSMANFVNEGFVRKHDFKTRQRRTPIRCVGFDGKEGVGGLVTQDWVGVIHVSSVDAVSVPLPCSFGVTRLGSVDAIFGLPWLDRQGWTASGSLKSGHHFTLGSTPLHVIEVSSLEDVAEDKLCTPSP